MESAISRILLWSARQDAGGEDFRIIEEVFSVIWISSVAMTALSQTRSLSRDSISFIFMPVMVFPRGHKGKPGEILSSAGVKSEKT